MGDWWGERDGRVNTSDASRRVFYSSVRTNHHHGIYATSHVSVPRLPLLPASCLTTIRGYGIDCTQRPPPKTYRQPLVIGREARLRCSIEGSLKRTRSAVVLRFTHCSWANQGGNRTLHDEGRAWQRGRNTHAEERSRSPGCPLIIETYERLRMQGFVHMRVGALVQICVYFVWLCTWISML